MFQRIEQDDIPVAACTSDLWPAWYHSPSLTSGPPFASSQPSIFPFVVSVVQLVIFSPVNTTQGSLSVLLQRTFQKVLFIDFGCCLFNSL